MVGAAVVVETWASAVAAKEVATADVTVAGGEGAKNWHCCDSHPLLGVPPTHPTYT